VGCLDFVLSVVSKLSVKRERETKNEKREAAVGLLEKKKDPLSSGTKIVVQNARKCFHPRQRVYSYVCGGTRYSQSSSQSVSIHSILGRRREHGEGSKLLLRPIQVLLSSVEIQVLPNEK
jgi:hypothetical protein